MRAARALDMLLLLQRRGRMTAGELAARLEVSERTVLRDVEVLSEAGIPVYTSRGTGGGIQLMRGFTTDLTGLTEQEAACLALAGQPEVAARLGLGAPTRSAAAKLAAALPPAAAEQAQALASWFVHDPAPSAGWGGEPDDVRRLVRGISARRRVELTFPDAAGEAPTGPRMLVVEPLGVVLKAGAWHLVTTGAAPDDEPVVMALNGVRTRLTAQRFERPAGFSAMQFWATRGVQHGDERRGEPEA